MAQRILVRVEGMEQAWADPSEEQLFDLISELNLRNQYMIVDRVGAPNDQYYIQLRISDELDFYDIEYRDGSPDTHFTAVVDRDNEFAAQELVSRVITQWAFERDGWREALPWRPWTPERCNCCGQTITTSGQIDFRLYRPEVAIDMPRDAVHAVNPGLLRVDGVGAFARCLLPIALTEGVTMVFGAWMKISDADLERAASVWHEDAYKDLVLQGTFANVIKPWGEEILDAPLTAVVRNVDEIPYVDASDHPLLHRMLTEPWNRDYVLGFFGVALPVTFRESIGGDWTIERTAGLAARVEGTTLTFTGPGRTVHIDQFTAGRDRPAEEFLNTLLKGAPDVPVSQSSRQETGVEVRYCFWLANTVDGKQQNEVYCFVAWPGAVLRVVFVHDDPSETERAWAMHVFNSVQYHG
ncbi:DUF2199 domain-containing protein [Actinosynnema sp. ALI-1.44]|uniref:DUF2199 domain-containing protein n=1 Tax=Actinosynnema sp. ALI-1.44 TaxID=1933779 RepID=UPI001177FFCD|nr:DUF2199 domain-containing protein [Actinosynnema sp. ALI-1.44]